MADLPQQSLTCYQNDPPCFYSPSSLNEVSLPPRRYNCSVCSASFRRREHFERHLQSHSKSKNFKCDTCDKRFTRRDTLQRHSAIHGQVPAKVRKPSTRAPLACLNCVKSKQRCSGSQPCDRCNHRNWPCQFPGGSTTFPETIEQTMMNSNNQMNSLNHGYKPSLASAISPMSTSYSDPRSLGSVSLLEGPCAEPAVSNQPERTIQDDDTASLFESFLLWPLDDTIDHNTMPGDSTRPLMIPRPPGIIAQPPSISHGGRTGVINASQVVSGHHTEDTGPRSSDQSDVYVQGIDLTEEDRDILISEDYAHVPRPSNETYERMRALYAEVRQYSAEAPLSSLPSLDILHVFIQLYSEHFHPSFPILHQATFEARSSSWLLYLVMAALGSQYSKLSTRAKIASDLVKIIHVSLLQKLYCMPAMQNDLELAQTTLLFHFTLLFGGTREGMMHLQYQRNVLVTMCRPLLVPGILFAKSWVLSNASVSGEDWSQWIIKESWKRLVYFTWLMECFQLILLDLPVIISISDLHISMPCDDDLWRCESFERWKQVRALRSDPQECPSVLSMLKMDIMDYAHINRLSDLALWISAVSVYVIDRQASQQQPLQILFSTHNIPNLRNLHSTEVVRAAGPEEDTIDVILGRFQQAVSERRHDSPICLNIAKISLIMRLLRFMKYRPLYLSSGWMARNEEVRAARQYIAELIHAKPKEARQGLLHAAHLFRIIRSQRQFDPFDSFILLMASLYIWNYDLHAVSHTPLNEGREEILRIDQTLDANLQEKWIVGTLGKRTQLHISGIGVLNGQNSMSRIFKEAVRILDHDKAWSRQANAIKRSLQQILRGGAPSFTDEESATNENAT
ncbi:hypothetical protein BO83DRAFT_378746 [Aspergillus eucalypticola CBS 122712]|uniref:C2H2 type zinc finger domain protein n=1 Tax=Aspergillus eucalypticola (strain CBS 122712 / IBT 29274) TaxID=1448314 RepID=A0A317VHY8_ASPEC|nr:uncharacterized protein BO83DRAFT_378746 [Aspergillus eucalypticola CBS 122712]PWY72801.1 hypothetical protein BO83DRAFT_378746 [Aspergillus eucalypticola CBS 122712]